MQTIGAARLPIVTRRLSSPNIGLSKHVAKLRVPLLNRAHKYKANTAAQRRCASRHRPLKPPPIKLHNARAWCNMNISLASVPRRSNASKEVTMNRPGSRRCGIHFPTVLHRHGTVHNMGHGQELRAQIPENHRTCKRPCSR